MEVEKKFHEDMRKALAEHKEKLHRLSLAHAAEMLTMKKKLETAEVK